MRKFTIRLNKGKASKKTVNPNKALPCIKGSRSNDQVIINRGANGITRISGADFERLMEAANYYKEEMVKHLEEIKDCPNAPNACELWRWTKELERALRLLPI